MPTKGNYVNNDSMAKALPAATAPAHPTKRGTREWSDHSLNIGTGCSHDCRYCYARANALKFGAIRSPEAWTGERLKKPMPIIRKFNGAVMFPTNHDITPFYLPAALSALKSLLEMGNQVLVVTKPRMECVSRLCSELAMHKAQVLFRFSIGTQDEGLARFWEPCAPSVEERASCLRYAFSQGFATSVSMEPMLAGTDDAVRTFHWLIPWVTDKIWLGKMNQINRRVARTTSDVTRACERIEMLQANEEILQLVQRLSAHRQVAWKDSVREVIRAHGSTPDTHLNATRRRSA